MRFRERLSGWRPKSKSRTPSPNNASTSTELGVISAQDSDVLPSSEPSLQVTVPPTISITSPTPSTPLPPPIPSPAERESTYGLLSIHIPPSLERSSATSSDPTFPIDIIAVHGLRGDAYSTWIHADTSFFWLRDSLPKELPGARIYSFGYDAGIFSRETGDFDDNARNLLTTLSHERVSKELQRRPIVFICHSMGGIVVKRALNVTRIEEDLFSDIREQTKAILFMATPHTGSESASLGGIAADILGLPLPKGVLNSRSALIKSLKRDSKGLVDISTEFRFFTKTIKFYSFIEKSITPIYGRVIVSDASGRLQVPSEELIMMNGCDHQNICRFESEKSPSYKLVMGVLRKVGMELTTHVIKMITAEDKPCLDSLSFSSMNDRFIQATKAHPSTCNWILSHPIFHSWQNSDRGLLWIKGNPGSGKSTLMAFLYARYLSLPTHAQDISLDFFFHGNGTTLQKSSLGMLRSLLHQLYKQSLFARAVVQDVFKEKTRDYQEWQWQTEELQTLLSDIICRLPKRQNVLIFVDALDEAMNDGVRAAGKLVSYLHALNDRINEVGGSTKICISCRHYPVVATRDGLEIRMQDENQEDIAKYIRWHLESGVENWSKKPEIVRRELESAIVWKANGIFLWVRLRIETIIENLNDGYYTVENMRQLINEESNELFPLYKEILEKVLNTKAPFGKKALLFMQWVCLAERPLSVEELRLAMACDKDFVFEGQRKTEDSKDFIVADETMEQLTKSLSGGLAEIRHHGGKSTVQLFHQTAKEFLLESGIKILFPLWCDDQGISNMEIIGRSEDRLAKSCINYLKMEDLLDDANIWGFQVEKEFKFVQYATKFWLLHAERAEYCGASQLDLIKIFGDSPRAFTTWKMIFQDIDKSGDWKSAAKWSNLIHIAASSNLVTVCKALLEQGVSVNEKDVFGRTPLNRAAQSGHVGLVKLFIEWDADIDMQDNEGHTALEVAAENGREVVVKFLFETGADINKKTGRSGTALHTAASKGDLRTVKFLIDSGADINVKSGFHSTALQEALCAGHEDVVKYLLNSGADPNSRGGHYGSPLQAAICAKGTPQKRLDLAMFFLNAGVNVNIKGGHYGNALQAALAGVDNGDLVRVLLDRGADINAKGGYYGFPLQAACDAFAGDYETFKLLLSLGAEVNAQGGKYGTALQAAANLGDPDLVKLLVDSGADLNLQGGEYGSALNAAVGTSKLDIFRFLLDRGATIVPGVRDGTILRAAVRSQNIEVIKILLDKGIDINEGGGEDSSILVTAITAISCNANFIRFLLDCGANMNDRDDSFGMPMEAAVYYGLKEVVELLLDRGADMWQKGRGVLRYYTPVEWAARQGESGMLRVLLEKGGVNMHGKWYEYTWDVAKRHRQKGVLRLLEEMRAATT